MSGDDVVTVNAVPTTIVKLFCTLLAGVLLSVTRILKLGEPVAVGVPLRTPALDRDNPAGSEPDARVQVYGAVPPVALRFTEYATPTNAGVNGDVFVIVSGPAITSVMALVTTCGGLLSSLTPTVKLNVPEAVGVPLRFPPPDSDSPEGNAPDAIDQL